MFGVILVPFVGLILCAAIGGVGWAAAGKAAALRRELARQRDDDSGEAIVAAADSVGVAAPAGDQTYISIYPDMSPTSAEAVVEAEKIGLGGKRIKDVSGYVVTTRLSTIKKGGSFGRQQSAIRALRERAKGDQPLIVDPWGKEIHSSGDKPQK
jgi:hypothetical protein